MRGYVRLEKCNGLSKNTEEFENYMGRNNCYTYAINQPVNPFTKEKYTSWDHIQPGNLGDRNGKDILVEGEYDHIMDLVKADLLTIGYEFKESTLEEYTDVQGAWKVAFAFEMDGDYHWYRQNDNGTWSHKKGGNYVSFEDYEGNVIIDPKECHRGRYKEFVGYYMITPIAVENIKGEESVA